jgi:hypothetical protein
LGDAVANLLLAGVPKAGTTSLFEYLGQHPDICASTYKGPGYFSPLRRGEPLPSLASYNENFAHCPGRKYSMEATPGYCYGGRRLVEGVKRTLDEPRIILSLRNPVDRLWSSYTWQRSRGNLPAIESFEQYISMCNQKRVKGEKQGPYFGGVSISFYGEYVPDWFDVFGDDVKVIFSDDLFARPQAVVTELCGWLGIDDRVAASFDYGVRNKTAHARNERLSRRTHSLKRLGDGVLRHVPGVKRGLRKVYLRVNTRDELEEKLRPETRRELEAMFRESNAVVGEVLRSRGYARLPSWIESKWAQTEL